MAKPMRIAYSTMAIPTCVRAVIRMPAIAMTSMTTATTVPIAIQAQLLVEVDPKTASTDGPSTRSRPRCR